MPDIGPREFVLLERAHAYFGRLLRGLNWAVGGPLRPRRPCGVSP